MDFLFLTETPLFRGTTAQDLEPCWPVWERTCAAMRKDKWIYRAGEVISSLGIMLSGSALIENDDIWGNTTVLDCVGPGQIFAETYAVCPMSR